MYLKQTHKMSILYPFLLGFFVFIFSSCKKAAEPTWIKNIPIQTSYTLYEVEINTVSNAWYIAGGDRYSRAIAYTSLDQGNSWNTLLDEENNGIYGAAFSDSIHLFVGYASTIWSSKNNLKSTTLNPFCLLNKAAITSPNTWYAVGENGTESGFLFTSTDEGKNWEVQHFLHQLKDIQFTSPTNGHACGHGAVYKTTDAGKNWTLASLRGDLFMDIDFVTPEIGFVVGFEGNIYKTTDGGNSWDCIQKGNGTFNRSTHFLSADFYDAQHGAAVGWEGILLTTHDGGNSWKKINTKTSNSLQSVKMIDANTVIIVGEKGTAFILKE